MHELEAELGALLSALRLNYKRTAVIEGISVQYVVDVFGVIICGVNRADYAIVNQAIEKDYKDWRLIYITTFDNVSEKRYEIIWALMRGGYLKWLRESVSDSVFRNMMFYDNFANKIINKRLEIWGDKPKFKYLVNNDLFAKGQGRISEYLSKEPGYFDHMPEE